MTVIVGLGPGALIVRVSRSLYQGKTKGQQLKGKIVS